MKANIRITLLVLLLMVLPIAVFADEPLPNGEGDVPAHPAVDLDLGEVCANSTETGTALIAIRRQGGNNISFQNSSTATISVSATSGTGLTASIDGLNTITLPEEWLNQSANTASDGYVTSSVILEAGSPGLFEGTVTYTATGTSGNNQPLERSSSMTVTAEIVDCSPADETAPTITINTPPDGAVYLLNQIVYADYQCEDEVGGSGLHSCVGDVPDGDPIDTSSVGHKSFTVDAEDNAGNTATVTHYYSVIYDFDGFFQPIDNDKLNVVQAGRAIPVKFSLDGDHGMDIFALGYPKVWTISCDPGAAELSVEETVTAGNSSLSYDAETDQYNYVWKTANSWKGQCRQLEVKLIDGTSHFANFRFR
jgi:hypothetical protein